MATHDIIVIGASAGGLVPLREIVQGLPRDLPAAVFVVLHIAPFGRSYLPKILAREGALQVTDAADGEPIVMGRIYVAPPDLHLIVEPGHIRVTHAPAENRSRPAVDPLFRSAAYAYGPRVVGVVLSGLLNDGTAGLWAIKYRGGVAVAQEPEEALHDAMPMSAIENVEVDHRVRVAEIAPLLVRLAGEEVSEMGVRRPTKMMEIETRIAMGDWALEAGVLELGKPSLITCPECHGTLLHVKEGSIDRFRCHTGHAFSAETLLADIDSTIEESLWGTMRMLEEKAMLMRQISESTRLDGNGRLAQAYRQKSEEAREAARVVRGQVMKHRHLSRERLQAKTSNGDTGSGDMGDGEGK